MMQSEQPPLGEPEALSPTEASNSFLNRLKHNRAKIFMITAGLNYVTALGFALWPNMALTGVFAALGTMNISFGALSMTQKPGREQK